jgi:hypothetical protein
MSSTALGNVEAAMRSGTNILPDDSACRVLREMAAMVVPGILLGPPS